jgi:hypothetical protein
VVGFPQPVGNPTSSLLHTLHHVHHTTLGFKQVLKACDNAQVLSCAHVLHYGAMDPCDNRNMDQVLNDSKFINMKTAVNYYYSSMFHIMEARSILTYDKLKDDAYENNVSFTVRMDDDA